MKILIKNDAADIYKKDINYAQYSRDFYKKLQAMQGQLLEVDTKYLFNDQFNTVDSEETGTGCRIMGTWVEKVIDDARVGSFRCNWCGKWWHPEEPEPKPSECPYCKKTEYIFALDRPEEEQLRERRVSRAPLFTKPEPLKGSGSIKVSPQHGLNPALDLCPWCGEARGVALLGRLPDDKEAPRSLCTSMEPCDKCRAEMDKGITFFEATPKPNGSSFPEAQKGVYPTGNWCVVVPAAVEKLFDEPFRQQVLDKKAAFLDSELYTAFFGAPQDK